MRKVLVAVVALALAASAQTKPAEPKPEGNAAPVSDAGEVQLLKVQHEIDQIEKQIAENQSEFSQLQAQVQQRVATMQQQAQKLEQQKTDLEKKMDETVNQVQASEHIDLEKFAFDRTSLSWLKKPEAPKTLSDLPVPAKEPKSAAKHSKK